MGDQLEDSVGAGSAVSLEAPPQPGMEARGFGHIDSEREILRVLWLQRDRYLVRGEVFRRIPPDRRPSAGRVGQILSAMAEGGLLQKESRRAQGSSRASGYCLALSGEALCLKLKLNIDAQDRPVFFLTHDEQVQLLTAQRLAHEPAEPAHISVLYSFKSGYGQTTIAAHVAYEIARENKAREEGGLDVKDLLVINLDLESTDLDRFFDPDDIGRGRGIGRLVLDYLNVEKMKREMWMRTALKDEAYIIRPYSGLPLVYLPACLDRSDTFSPDDRAQVLALLRLELGLEAESPSTSFLDHFRAALQTNFEKVIVDSQSGYSAAARIACCELADELILCTRRTESRGKIVEGVRTVAASFLDARRVDESGGNLIFMFPARDPEDDARLESWLKDELLKGSRLGEHSEVHFTSIPDDPRMAVFTGTWENTSLYRALTRRLQRRQPDPGVLPSPVFDALQHVLDPSKDKRQRSVAAGVLASAPLPEMGRLLDWYVQTSSLHVETDDYGRDLVKEVANTQARWIMQKLLKPKDYDRG